MDLFTRGTSTQKISALATFASVQKISQPTTQPTNQPNQPDEQSSNFYEAKPLTRWSVQLLSHFDFLLFPTPQP